MSKRLSKYIASFDYFDKSVIVLFTTVTGVHAGITSASFSLVFSIYTGIVKNLLETRS